MPRCLVADTYYDAFLASWKFDEKSTYEAELRRLLDFKFGTFDAYSQNLRALGWEVIDIIANAETLQDMWALENGVTHNILGAQIDLFQPDVVFLQDLNVTWNSRQRPTLIAAQCSCPLPPIAKVQQCDVIFTSFPHYVKKFEEAGVRAVFNPLAFEPVVADWCFPEMMPAVPTESVLMDFGRIHDVVFIGGVGAPSHWKRGMETLHAVAEAIPTFKWWGYGQDLLPSDSALRQKWQGSAFGLDMYKILLQSKIALCRHGEVSEGYSNAMRMFESTGCGALLLTEASRNIGDFFTEDEALTYHSADDCVRRIDDLLGKWSDVRAFIATNGQKKTLEQHTYAQRMRVVSDTLKEMLL